MKKQRKLLFKRGLAVFLVLTMCVGMLQMTAFAAEAGDDSDVTVVTPDDDNRTTSNNSEPAAQDEGQDDDSSEPEETLPKDVDRIETPSDHPTAEPDGDNATWESDVKDSEGNTVGTATGSESNTVDSTENNPDGTKQSESGTVTDEEHSGEITVEVPLPEPPELNPIPPIVAIPEEDSPIDVEIENGTGETEITVDQDELDSATDQAKKDIEDLAKQDEPETQERVGDEENYTQTTWEEPEWETDEKTGDLSYQTVKTETKLETQKDLPAPMEVPTDATNVVTDEDGNVVSYVVTTTTINDEGVTVTETRTVTNGTMTIVKKTVTTTIKTYTVKVNSENGKVIVTGADGEPITVIAGEGHGTEHKVHITPDMDLDPMNGHITADGLYGWSDDILARDQDNENVEGTAYLMNGNQLLVYFDDDGNQTVLGRAPQNKYNLVYVSETRTINGKEYGVIGTNLYGNKIYVPMNKLAVPEAQNGEYLYYGENGLSSAVGIGHNGTDNGSHTYNAHQFVVMGPDGKRYVYCADISRPPEHSDYEENNGYLSGESLELVKAIAANGYWGASGSTAADAGSLESFKSWLKGMGYEGDMSGLTEGVAMAVTQAAIWKYANSSNGNDYKLSGKFTDYYYNNKILDDGAALGNQLALGEELLAFLTGNTDEVKKSTEVTEDGWVNEAKITVTTVKVTDSKVDKDTNEVTENTADITFRLDVEPATLTKDTKVTIIGSDGKTYGVYQLDGTSKLDKLINNDDKTYTIEGVSLPNGVNLTLKLEGSQLVKKEAYVITAVNGYTSSQTFVGADATYRDFNLNVSLNLEVQQATATITTTYGAQTEGTQEIDQFWNSMWESSYTYTPGGDDDVIPGDDDDDDDDVIPGDDDDDDDDVIPGDDDDDDDGDDDDDTPTTPPTTPDPEVNVPAEPTPLAEVPADPTPLAEVPEEAVPLAEVPEELEEIPEEEVPLADVPATGDISAMWYVMTILAACGLLFMHVLDGKKRRDGES